MDLLKPTCEEPVEVPEGASRMHEQGSEVDRSVAQEEPPEPIDGEEYK